MTSNTARAETQMDLAKFHLYREQFLPYICYSAQKLVVEDLVQAEMEMGMQ